MILTRQSPTTIELTDRRRTMAAHSDELSVATEITAATTETKLLDSRKTEQVHALDLKFECMQSHAI
jgi:hypothetical protein